MYLTEKNETNGLIELFQPHHYPFHLQIIPAPPKKKLSFYHGAIVESLTKCIV